MWVQHARRRALGTLHQTFRRLPAFDVGSLHAPSPPTHTGALPTQARDRGTDADLRRSGELVDEPGSGARPRRTYPTLPSDGCPSTCRQSVARVAMMSRDVAKMSPRCRGRVAVCCASVAGESRRRRSLSRRRRSLSRRRRGGSPCREVSRGVAGCRGRVAACHAAVAVCRAAVAGGSRSVAPPSRSVAPPSRAGRHPSHRRRGLSRGVVGVAGHLFSVKTATCTWTPIGGGGQGAL